MKKLTHQELTYVSGGYSGIAALAGGMYAGYNNDDETYEAVARTTGWAGAALTGYAYYGIYNHLAAATALSTPVVWGITATCAVVSMAMSFPVNRFATFLGYKAGEYAAA